MEDQANELWTRDDRTNDPGHAMVTRAYLVADIVESTRVCVRRDEIAGYVCLRTCLERMCEAVHGVGGTLVKTLGDGMEACFENPLDALACGARIAAIPDRPDGGPFAAIRVALTFGRLVEYSVDGHIDYYGRAVIIGARISRYGSDGGVFMSSAFVGHPTITTWLGHHPLSRRRVHLKGIDEPVSIYALYPCGRPEGRRATAARVAEARSIKASRWGLAPASTGLAR